MYVFYFADTAADVPPFQIRQTVIRDTPICLLVRRTVVGSLVIEYLLVRLHLLVHLVFCQKDSYIIQILELVSVFL